MGPTLARSRLAPSPYRPTLIKLKFTNVDIPTNAKIGTRSARDTLPSPDQKLQECIIQVLQEDDTILYVELIAYGC